MPLIYKDFFLMRKNVAALPGRCRAYQNRCQRRYAHPGSIPGNRQAPAEVLHKFCGQKCAQWPVTSSKYLIYKQLIFQLKIVAVFACRQPIYPARLVPTSAHILLIRLCARQAMSGKVIDLKEQYFPAQKTSIPLAMCIYTLAHMFFWKSLAPEVAYPAVLHINCG
jgi:hypothetical protein